MPSIPWRGQMRRSGRCWDGLWAAPQRGDALDYVRGWRGGEGELLGLAEEAGHENPHRMQALLRGYRWDWTRLRAELAGLARAWLPCDPGDLIGPGIAVDETAQLKDGDDDRVRGAAARRMHRARGELCHHGVLARG